MRRFLLFFPISKLVKGGRYRLLPLHCPVLHHFSFKEVELGRLVETIKSVTSVHFPLLLKAGRRRSLDKYEEIPITLIEENLTLANFHMELYAAMSELGATMEHPEMCQLEYRPYVPDYQGQKLPVKYKGIAKELALTESAEGSDWESVVELFDFRTP